MEKYADIYGMYVAFNEFADDYNAYMHLKSVFEEELKDAVHTIKDSEHEGFDVGFLLFQDEQAVLTCCVDSKDLWIGLYVKQSRMIQRYVIFDDVKALTDEDIKRFASIIENIARNPNRILTAKNIAKAWQDELARMDKN